MPNAIPEFGQAIPGVKYVLRPGGYAIIVQAGQIAIVTTPRGAYLPGGGQEPGESPADAAVREAREECGFDIRVTGLVGVADELVYTPDEANHWRKRCTFFLAELVSDQHDRVEADHQLSWVSLNEAAVKLRHESQRWAVMAARPAITR